VRYLSRQTAVPDLIRDLHQKRSRTGGGSNPSLRSDRFNRSDSKRRDGVLHLYLGLQIQHGNLHWRDRQSFEPCQPASAGAGWGPHQKVQDHQTGIFRGSQHAGGGDRARVQTEAMEACLEEHPDRDLEPKLGRSYDGAVFRLRSRNPSGTALHLPTRTRYT